jgi:hypothetical protein
MRGTQQFQRGVCGDEFHHRRRVKRLVAAMHGHRLSSADFVHIKADAAFGNARAGECLRHRRRQLGLCGIAEKY